MTSATSGFALSPGSAVHLSPQPIEVADLLTELDELRGRHA
jgi:hypothetical protein